MISKYQLLTMLTPEMKLFILTQVGAFANYVFSIMLYRYLKLVDVGLWIKIPVTSIQGLVISFLGKRFSQDLTQTEFS